MAENENGQEKTEDPTDKRLRESREKGQVPRSREFNTLAVLLAGAVFGLLFGRHLGEQTALQFAAALNLDRIIFYDTGLMLASMRDQIGRALMNLVPLLAVLFATALLGPILVGGANFSTQALAPKFSKLNPISGLKRVFSVQGLMELLKALGKLLLVSAVSGLALWAMFDQVMALGDHPVERGIVETARMAAWIFLVAVLALVLVAVIDVPFQLWNSKKQLRMTKQEIKDEYKETEGKPEVKGRIRQMQMEMAQRRMMADVPKADVIITNPTHFAVAVAYDAARMRAPRLLAKGTDAVALRIRELAEEHRIVRVEAPKVARAIYFTTELGEEIPAGLFVAVARILAYVYQLKRHDPDVAIPHDLPVPDEYLDPQAARRARSAD